MSGVVTNEFEWIGRRLVKQLIGPKYKFKMDAVDVDPFQNVHNSFWEKDGIVYYVTLKRQYDTDKVAYIKVCVSKGRPSKPYDETFASKYATIPHIRIDTGLAKQVDENEFVPMKHEYFTVANDYKKIDKYIDDFVNKISSN